MKKKLTLIAGISVKTGAMLILICNLQFTIFNCFSQDIHFSQFYMTPTLLNPALTGVHAGNHRAFLNYKRQWPEMMASGVTYTTTMFSYDAGLFKKKFSSGYLGAGISAYKDMSGDLKMGTTQINLSLSGIVYLNENQLLSGGLQGGYAQKSISMNSAQWDNQYDETTGTFNSSISSGDIASVPPYQYGDFSAGVAWNYASGESSLFSNNQLKANLGAAMHHINRPKQKFNPSVSNEKLNSKLVIHGTAQIGIGNTNYDVVPSAIIFQQGSATEINAGMMIRWTIKEESKRTGYFKETALSLGAQYRAKDAFIPVMLFEYANYALGFSYDVNTSSLTKGTNGKGGMEFSLRYINPNPFKGGAEKHKSVRFL